MLDFIRQKKNGTFQTCEYCRFKDGDDARPCKSVQIEHCVLLSGYYDFFLPLYAKGIRDAGEFVMSCIRSRYEEFGIEDTQTIMGSIIPEIDEKK
jgi:hypothetical protein